VHDPAADLAVDQQRIDELSAIVGDYVAQDLHRAGLGIDLQEPAQLMAHVRLECRAGIHFFIL
jgi:hypothetical protein